MFLPSTTQNSKLEDDQKIFDASRLTLHQAADDEVSGHVAVHLFKCAAMKISMQEAAAKPHASR